MRRLFPFSLLCLLYYCVTSLVIVAPIGCGGSSNETGAQVALPEQEVQAQNQMENFMKTQKTQKKK